jgi:predicted PolB exonuclease-like 3'-5' exonuclease
MTNTDVLIKPRGTLSLTAATGAPATKTAFLVLDTESVPDGRLLGKVKYGDEPVDDEEAVRRAQAEAREKSPTGSDFLPVTFQYPVAVCVVRVAADFGLLNVTCLDAPHFRPREIVKKFWLGANSYKAKLVTFNGRCFDLPLLELAAFRYGCSSHNHFYNSRNRYGGNHIDLLDWLTNYGACRLAGGLDLLSKLLGKPGKMEVSGDQVYAMYLAGRRQQINDYCMFDTLDTYFIFLRTRVLTGDLTLEQEHDLVKRAKAFLTARVGEQPGLRQYLDNWGEWEPWP